MEGVTTVGWKMIRNRMENFLTGAGVSGRYRKSPDPIASLTQKLGEELGEWAGARNPAELYDLRDVVDELILLADPSGAAGDQHVAKVAMYGLFSDHLEWTPMPEEE